MKLDSNVLRGLLVGTVLASLLLAAQGGGNPLREAAWILVGTTLAAVTDGYGSHASTHGDAGAAAYVVGLARSVAHEWSLAIACLPTVVLLGLAALLGWHDDPRNPDGSVTVGYTTIGLNLNVVLLFVWSAIAARRGGRTWPVAALFGLLGGGLGLIIIRIELALG
jgi:hypothetical protein